MADLTRIAPEDLISEPGCYAGLDIGRYHGQCTVGPSISSSGLRRIFTESPAHFYATSDLNPERVEEPESDALILGRAAHHLLLGETSFASLFTIRPERWDSWRTADAKAWRDEQIKAGKTVLIPSQVEAIRGMHASLAAHPHVRGGILDGAIEQSLIWRDEETGIWLKARPDAVPNASGDFADLKTAASVTPEDIQRSVSDNRYDMQAALVKWGAKEVLGIDMTDFALVFVEKTQPHCVEIRVIRHDDIAEAEADLRAALRLFAKCLSANRWPGPGGEVSEIRNVGLSDFARRRAADRRAFIQQEIGHAA